MKKSLTRKRLPGLAGFVLLTLVLVSQTVFAQGTLTFAVAGDVGERGQPQRDISRQMNEYRTHGRPFQMVLLLGDNIYEDGVGEGFVEEFEKPFKDLLEAGVKFFAALGNHDIRNGTQAQINYPKFNMGGRRFYSFTAADGLVEFFAVDSTPLTEEAEDLVIVNLAKLKKKKTQASLIHLSQPALAKLDSSIAESETFLNEMKAARSEQIPWLKDALKASTARWKIVFLHHAIYSSAYKNGGHGKQSGVLKLRKLLTPIFFENKVDVVFAGHDHVVEKIKPQIAPDNVHKVYYMTEGGSAKLRKGDLDKANSFHEWGEDRKYSFLLADLSQAELKIDVIDSSGKILKSFVLTK